MKQIGKQAGCFAAICLLLGLLFLLAPDIDLAATGLFYVQGEGFPLASWTPLAAFEDTVPWITRIIVVTAALGAVWLALIGRPLWRLDRKALVFLVVATALGPGLIANTILKDHWGRARPYQTDSFGGARQFTPAPLPATQCERNCAFVSGHAALAFSLVSFVLLLPVGRSRRLAIAACCGFGALVGIGRIAAGAHFLSDVAYAGMIVVATSWLLYQVIVVRDLLAGAAALRAWRAAGTGAGAARRFLADLYVSPAGRVVVWAGAMTLIAEAAILWIDRPLALFLHRHAEWHSPAEAIQRLGFGTPYLIAFGLGFVALRWGGLLPRLRPRADRMREAAMVPAFLLSSVAASGLAVDLLKVIFGRTRPKLLFADGMFDFSWLGLAADHWSFPSGHTAAVAALMTALWCLWPRHVLFYVALASVVAASRVVTGAHYLSDVVAGGFVAVIVTRAIAAGFVRFRLKLPFGRGSVPQPVLPLP
jgi:lipid A 4'-phosphatase